MESEPWRDKNRNNPVPASRANPLKALSSLSQSFNPSNPFESDEDIDIFKMCEDYVEKVLVKVNEIICKPKVASILDNRRFYNSRGEHYSSKKSPGIFFRILSYNILADHLVKPENYFEFETQYVEKHKRMKNIFR